MPKLSAPTDEFLAELDRYSVPFSLEIAGHTIQTPPAAWERVFNGPHDERGRPKNTGGLTASCYAAMRAKAAELNSAAERRSTTNVVHAGAAYAPVGLLSSMPAVSLPEEKHSLQRAESPEGSGTDHRQQKLSWAETSAGARADSLRAPNTTPSGGSPC